MTSCATVVFLAIFLRSSRQWRRLALRSRRSKTPLQWGRVRRMKVGRHHAPCAPEGMEGESGVFCRRRRSRGGHLPERRARAALLECPSCIAHVPAPDFSRALWGTDRPLRFALLGAIAVVPRRSLLSGGATGCVYPSVPSVAGAARMGCASEVPRSARGAAPRSFLVRRTIFRRPLCAFRASPRRRGRAAES